MVNDKYLFCGSYMSYICLQIKIKNFQDITWRHNINNGYSFLLINKVIWSPQNRHDALL